MMVKGQPKVTTVKRPQPVEAATRAVVVAAILEAVGLPDVDPTDVLSIHLGQRTVNVRRKVRGRTGKIVPGHSLSATHDVLPEPLED